MFLVNIPRPKHPAVADSLHDRPDQQVSQADRALLGVADLPEDLADLPRLSLLQGLDKAVDHRLINNQTLWRGLDGEKRLDRETLLSSEPERTRESDQSMFAHGPGRLDGSRVHPSFDGADAHAQGIGHLLRLEIGLGVTHFERFPFPVGRIERFHCSQDSVKSPREFWKKPKKSFSRWLKRSN